MVGDAASNWTVRGVTFLLWAGAAASVVAWGLKLSSSSSANVPPAAVGLRPPVTDAGALARVLGASQDAPAAAAAQPSAASRMSLLGVVADRSQKGAALIAVEGRPPKPYRVGTLVDEGLVLKSVEARKAVLAASMDGPAVVTLELPPLAAPGAAAPASAAAPARPPAGIRR
jgi:general secretion pathway protein C